MGETPEEIQRLTEGAEHIATVTIDLYRTPDGMCRYVHNAIVRGDDPDSEDANIRMALLEVVKDYEGRA
jgi:hypothetical protein